MLSLHTWRSVDLTLLFADRAFLHWSWCVALLKALFLLTISQYITGILITDGVWYTLINVVPSIGAVYYVQISDYITVTCFIMGAITNLTTTFAISHQIYLNTFRDPHARRRYQHIIDALIQSCTIHTLSAIFDAILILLGIFQQNKDMEYTAYMCSKYVDLILTITSVRIQKLDLYSYFIFYWHQVRRDLRQLLWWFE